MLREGRSGFPRCNPDLRKALSQFKLNIAAEAAARVRFRERSADCCLRGRGSALWCLRQPCERTTALWAASLVQIM